MSTELEFKIVNTDSKIVLPTVDELSKFQKPDTLTEFTLPPPDEVLQTYKARRSDALNRISRAFLTTIRDELVKVAPPRDGFPVKIEACAFEKSMTVNDWSSISPCEMTDIINNYLKPACAASNYTLYVPDVPKFLTSTRTDYCWMNIFLGTIEVYKFHDNPRLSTVKDKLTMAIRNLVVVNFGRDGPNIVYISGKDLEAAVNDSEWERLDKRDFNELTMMYFNPLFQKFGYTVKFHEGEVWSSLKLMSVSRNV